MSGTTIMSKEDPMKTLIVVILDESGSMDVQKSDVIGGYNSFLDSQLEMTEDLARLVLVKFNTNVNVAQSATPLQDVPKLSNGNYIPGGGTALYDAISEGIRIAEATVQKDERVLILIMTDGEENSSKKTTAIQIKDMIAAHEKLGNWTFAYIGENPEGWAKTVGSAPSNAIPYDMQSQRQNFERGSRAVREFRSTRQQQQQVGFFSSIQEAPQQSTDNTTK